MKISSCCATYNILLPASGLTCIHTHEASTQLPNLNRVGPSGNGAQDANFRQHLQILTMLAIAIKSAQVRSRAGCLLLRWMVLRWHVGLYPMQLNLSHRVWTKICQIGEDSLQSLYAKTLCEASM